MKQVLVFGAGKSATVLIDYLLRYAQAGEWKVVVADADIELAKSKVNQSPHGTPVSFDVMDDQQRGQYIRDSDIVISMLPPALHFLVAADCLKFSKSLLTASYADEQIKSLAGQIAKKNILFLCEMGLDPGIDHMSAMKIIDEIHAKGGKITSFRSHCGGLVAPESDNNPWHYKISWNPRNIILAGKSGAHYRERGKEIRLAYGELFSGEKFVDVPGIGYLGYYPNRDSLSYTSLYGLEDIETFVRTTLRHPDFMYGWKNVIELDLTNESPVYQTDGKTLASVFKEHLDKKNFGEWLNKKMSSGLKETKAMAENLNKLAEAEQEAEEGGVETPGSFLSADDRGNLEEIQINDMKSKATPFVTHKVHEANLILKQLIFLGLNDKETIVNKGLCSAADVLQFAMERKLKLEPNDKDMVVMLHEFEYAVNDRKLAINSSLVVKGENSLRTAMAKTVGLPLGIAAKLILQGRITARGLHIPTLKEVYEPVLQELATHGIAFSEKRKDLPR